MELDKFTFATSNKIVFGWGCRKELPEYIAPFGKHVFLLHSKSVRALDEIEHSLQQAGFSLQRQAFSGEPTDDVMRTLIPEVRQAGVDCIVGIGGGSVLDAGKALAAMLTNEGDLLDYLEVVGKGLPLQNKPCPFVAMPTTAGTGTEVTKNAVIKVIAKNVKVSLRDISMIPKIALVDPELTLSVPQAVTASTGMDAFIQVLEPYCSRGANKMVDLFCREGIPLGAKYLPMAYQEPFNQEARTNMAWLSLLGGLSLSNAKLGAIHGFAGPIGGMFDIAHGTICACLLPQVFRVNARKVEELRDPLLLGRFTEIARWVSGKENTTIHQAVDWFIALNEQLKIPRLQDLGIKQKDYNSIIEKSLVSSSMKGNPVTLNRDDLLEILRNS